MPSPFPGMDPWLEQHWGDVHTRFVTYCSDRLQTALPRDLRARVEEREGRAYDIYKAPIDRRLPVIAVPLRTGDADVLLDLQAVLNDAYDRGGYDIIDYRKPPQPPLAGELAEWADQLLSRKQFR
ncbi:MAG: DUF4058 family protein [Planctomycetales bacterium]